MAFNIAVFVKEVAVVMETECYKDTLIDTLGIKIVEMNEKQVVATMLVNEATRQPFGLLHGGASAALAETVASLGTYYLIDPDTQYAVGIEINANHIRKKQSGYVTAVGKPVHRGKTIMVWDIKIKDETENLICVARCTTGVFPQRDSKNSL